MAALSPASIKVFAYDWLDGGCYVQGVVRFCSALEWRVANFRDLQDTWAIDFVVCMDMDGD